MGLLEDTKMDTNQFSYLALAFYITYLFFEFPTGYLMQRFPTAKYLGFNGKQTPLYLAIKLTDYPSRTVGPHDNVELHREELWRVNDTPSTFGLF